jgi:putative ABC transport system substrate-binding protein
LIHDPVFLPHATRVAALAARHRLPAIYQFRPYVADAGGLMSYEPDPSDQWVRTAVYVDKILNGANVGELPVERPTRFRFVINLTTARVLGLTIPPSVLQQTTEVIQ